MMEEIDKIFIYEIDEPIDLNLNLLFLLIGFFFYIPVNFWRFLSMQIYFESILLLIKLGYNDEFIKNDILDN